MKRKMKLLALLCAAAPFAAAAASTTTNTAVKTNASAPKPLISADALFTNSVVAKGKGVSVSRAQLDEELVRIKSNVAGQGRSLPADLEAQVLDGLVTKQLLLTKVTEADKVKGRELFEATLKKTKTYQKLTDEEFNQKLGVQLRLMNMTREDWEKQGIEQATFPIVLSRELKITATDEQAKAFYDENPARFEQPEMVRAAHILIGTRGQAGAGQLSDEQKATKKKQIEDLLKRARAGEDFAKLAKEYSEDPGSKDKGGEYTFPRGQMMPEFEAAAFSLNTNQVSDVVTTSYGYHIIKLYEKIPSNKTEFDKVSSDIKDFLKQREIQKQFAGYLQKLKKDADVQITDERLKLVEIAAPEAAAPDSPPKPAKK